MNTQIETQIARGIQLRKIIEDAKKELKGIEKAITIVARKTEHVDLVDAEREGKQALLEGDGVILPVIFESDMITGTMQWNGIQHKKLLALPGTPDLKPFYKESRVLEMIPDGGKQFRAVSRGIFEPEQHAAFISACLSRDKDGIPKSRIVVAWDNVKEI